MNPEVVPVGLRVAEVAVRTAVDFVKKVIPDELKPKEPVVERENPVTPIELLIVRAKLKALMAEHRIQDSPKTQPVTEASHPLEAKGVDFTA